MEYDVFNQNTGMSEILKNTYEHPEMLEIEEEGMIIKFGILTAIWHFEISHLGQMKFMFNVCQFHIQLTSSTF